MKIGLDIMGGDFAPKAAVLGAIEAYKVLTAGQKLVLIGDKEVALGILQENNFSPDNFEFVHTTEVIGMGEHPTKAIVQKPDSSIAVGFKLLKENAIQAFSSAGNTGAMLVGSMFSVKTIPGVIRPAMTAIVPKLKGGLGIILDVGANADCKPDVLLQFGVLGSLLAESIYGIPNPRVALMNIGEEEEKGNILSLATYPLMKDTKLFNFVGNVEGRDLFEDNNDVVVCDGFTGNVILKLSESFYVITLKKRLKDDFFDRFNYEQYGGSPILGVNAPVVVGHGISSPEAIKNMVLLSRNMIETNLIDKIKLAFQ
ncbi:MULTISPECIES: phosphate acyltransferase PlsX [unclassified Mucilaginibacter]|uniref:phosphate acyltransferase PlsX n=1 Tax=unclassified Mucilaginibacter TaxID=2617802 RepID=UPI002AC9863F|nr:MULTISPECIES: phosphate acyltransferase PlsX [unclassified Mucilaginibacter]MEB0279721.1 phosphate acyltransferase PlsX [Mucilaginibacter sp. 10B2]MEB0301686.1 phosphate acyltransferase PlsX [Mucilaginibacter sp. 5C4]WPX23720.1 phosphate acyltransferase PlsX [Mucilaginibacter sp. 5C4]